MADDSHPLFILAETKTAGWFNTDGEMAVGELERAVKTVGKLVGGLAQAIHLTDAAGLDYDSDLRRAIRTLEGLHLEALLKRVSEDVEFMKK